MKFQAGGVKLNDAPIMIGAGACKTPHKTGQWLKVAAVVSGSYTPLPRKGNEGNRLFFPDSFTELDQQGFALNSFGMPNVGFDAAVLDLDECRSKNPLVVSIAGFSIDDYVEGLEAFSEVPGIAAIECNFGCPNTEHGKIFSFDPKSIEQVFSEVGKSFTKLIWAKFSPYSDPGLLREIAKIVSDAFPLVQAVVTCNTFPNAYAGANAISPNGGLAGLSGPALKPIALGQVRQFRKELNPNIDVIGVGGIITGNDIVDFLDAGAKAVQLTSLPFFLDDPGKFLDVLTSGPACDRFVEFIEANDINPNNI